MKSLMLLSMIGVLLLAAGCGVNKDFVAQAIADSEGRTGEKISSVESATEANAAELVRLQSLATQLSEKTDLAINQAKGFENYQVIWSGEINFGYDSFEIDGIAADILGEAGQKMEAYPGAVAEFVGHTDNSGTSNYNLTLGERRAEAARTHLADKFGISLYRLFTLSYGEDKPVALPDEKNASSKNRRVVVKVWGQM